MIAAREDRISKLPTPEPQASAAPASSREARALRKRVLGLAAPVIGENFLETLLGIVDTLLVAGLGAVAIAGVGSALQVMFFLISALSALAIGSSVLVAQAVGAGDTAHASRLGRQSLIWSVLFSIPLSVGGFLLSEPIMGVFGLEREVAAISVQYLQVTMGTVVVLVALFIGSGVLRGAGDSRTPLRVTAIANLVNIVLAYGLIFGHFGLPALGPVGSAWATFLARGLALALLLVALWRGKGGVTISGINFALTAVSRALSAVVADSSSTTSTAATDAAFTSIDSSPFVDPFGSPRSRLRRVPR